MTARVFPNKALLPSLKINLSGRIFSATVKIQVNGDADFSDRRSNSFSESHSEDFERYHMAYLAQ
jgi:hypothetical protein